MFTPFKEMNIFISICLCTYHRPKTLFFCLQSLLKMQYPAQTEIVIVDNDQFGSAEHTVTNLVPYFKNLSVSINYYIEPQQGIASARNMALSSAKGNYIAFLDDDETVDSLWLVKHLESITKYNADGVWGPVIPIFVEGFPEWQKALFHRSRWSTGVPMNNKSKGTNNALIKRDIFELRKGPFNTQLNRIGGSDTDLFEYLVNNNAFFVWCNEAIVYEIQTEERTKLKWHVRRAYRGGWGFSLQKTKLLGRRKAFLLILFWIFLTTVKNFLLAFRYRDIRTILLIWLKILSTQLGKVGFFFGKQIEEYKQK